MIYFLLLSGAVALVVLTIIWALNFHYYYSKCNSLPIPTPLPIVGNILDYRDVYKSHIIFGEFFKKYGKTWRLNLVHKFFIVTIDPELVRTVLNSPKCLDKSSMYNFFLPWFEESIFVKNGEGWKADKKMYMPIFSSSTAKDFIPIYKKVSNVFIRELKKHVDGEAFDVCEDATLFAFDVYLETFHGVVDDERFHSKKYLHVFEELVDITYKRITMYECYFDFPYSLTRDCQERDARIKLMNDFLNSSIDARKKYLANKDNTDDNLVMSKVPAVADTWIQMNPNNKRMTEEANAMLLAGFHTIGQALQFALFNIANYPEVQKKIYEEQIAIFGNDRNRELCSDDLKEMNYLEMVLKESMRLYPVATISGRQASEDIKYNDIVIKKGTEILTYIHGILLDPDNFPDPDKYDPERFAESGNKANKLFNITTFSGGLRSCLGQRIAWIEMKIFLSQVIRVYELLPAKPVHKPNIVFGMLNSSSNGLFIRIKNR